MNNEHYDYVLKDLISQRDELNRTIEMIQKMKESSVFGMMGKRSIDDLHQSVGVYSPPTADYRYAYKGMTLLPAIKKLLETTSNPLRAHEMADKLQEGGMEFESDTPHNTIASILSRALGDNDHDIVKVDRGLFTHKRWTR